MLKRVRAADDNLDKTVFRGIYSSKDEVINQNGFTVMRKRGEYMVRIRYLITKSLGKINVTSII